MRPSALQAVAGGFVATAAITAVRYWVAPLLLGAPMDIAKTLGDFLGIDWTAGMVLHFINGSLIFPLVYAFVLFGVLPGGPATKGVTFGVVLWLLGAECCDADGRSGLLQRKCRGRNGGLRLAPRPSHLRRHARRYRRCRASRDGGGVTVEISRPLC